jgi:host factor-I protein
MDEANNPTEVSATGPTAARRKRRPAASNATGHEALYLKSLVERQRTVQIKLRDGERVRGCIEYFDDNIIRLNRDGEPNLFLYKHHIQTIRETTARRGEPGSERP